MASSHPLDIAILEILRNSPGWHSVEQVADRGMAAGKMDPDMPLADLVRRMRRILKQEPGEITSRKDGGMRVYCHKSVAPMAIVNERELDGPLVDFLRQKLGVDATPIRHPGGRRKEVGSNQWRYPDLVGFSGHTGLSQPVRKLAGDTGTGFRELYSFEVKIRLETIAEVRQAFFECLGNSGWANRRYVVAATVSEEAFEEFQGLAGRYNMGLISLPLTSSDPRTFQPRSQILLNCHRQDLDVMALENLCRSWKALRDWAHTLAQS